MLFCRIDQNGNPVEFPITERILRQTLSSKILPASITNEDLIDTEFRCVPSVLPEEVPHQTKDMRVVLGDLIKTDTGFKRTYVLQAVPAHVYEQRLAFKWNEVRLIRDQMLKEADWRISRYNREVRMGATPTDNIIDLDIYMEALADITTQADPYLLNWPIPPWMTGPVGA